MRKKELVDQVTGELTVGDESSQLLELDQVPPPKEKPQDARGRELPDPTPMAPPVGFKKQKSLTEQIREQIRSEALRFAAESAGAETFEDADDFEVGDFDPSSPYEEQFEPTPIEELKRRKDAAEAEYARGIAEAGKAAVQQPPRAPEVPNNGGAANPPAPPKV